MYNFDISLISMIMQNFKIEKLPYNNLYDKNTILKEYL